MNVADLRTGDTLPEWSRVTGMEHWNRFAAVNDEFVPMHMDDAAGRKAGNPSGAFGMGNLRYAYLLNAIRDWLGDLVQIRSLQCQFRALNLRDDTLTVRGTIVALSRSDEECVLELHLDVVNQDGASTSPAQALVAVPLAATEARQ